MKPNLLGLVRPDVGHIPDQVWPPHREKTGVVVNFDYQGRYVTAECQLGAHHGCPGGMFSEGGRPLLQHRCRCVADGCSCNPATPR